MLQALSLSLRKNHITPRFSTVLVDHGAVIVARLLVPAGWISPQGGTTVPPTLVTEVPVAVSESKAEFPQRIETILASRVHSLDIALFSFNGNGVSGAHVSRSLLLDKGKLQTRRWNGSPAWSGDSRRLPMLSRTSTLENASWFNVLAFLCYAGSGCQATRRAGEETKRTLAGGSSSLGKWVKDRGFPRQKQNLKGVIFETLAGAKVILACLGMLWDPRSSNISVVLLDYSMGMGSKAPIIPLGLFLLYPMRGDCALLEAKLQSAGLGKAFLRKAYFDAIIIANEGAEVEAILGPPRSKFSVQFLFISTLDRGGHAMYNCRFRLTALGYDGLKSSFSKAFVTPITSKKFKFWCVVKAKGQDTVQVVEGSIISRKADNSLEGYPHQK